MVDDQTGGASAPQQPAQPQWCAVGNVVAQRLHGEDGEQRPGSKLFTGGTRVYYRSAYWGMGGESVTVLGLGRRPRRWITATVRSSLIENWRAKLIYTPRVLQELQADDVHGDEGDARALADVMNRISAASSRRLVARTAQECHQAAAAPGARILAGPTLSGHEQDQALILYRGTEAIAGLVYQAAPPVVRAPHATPFTWSYLWVRPFVEPTEIGTGRSHGEPAETVATFCTALQTRFPWYDLSTLYAELRTSLQT